MTRARDTTTPGIALAGLRPAPAQQWGGVRMIPLIREHVRHDLRITRRKLDAHVVTVGDGTAYCSFMPHAFVLDWSDDGHPLAATGGQLHGPGSQTAKPRQTALVHRMAKREDRNALRFVPLHLAMEGFLALHFGGPDVAWTEYSREAMSRGLSPRRERSVAGMWIDGLAEALRVFEIHDTQVGVLILVADALASAFVLPRPEDYRELHRSLLSDFYGELLYQYGLLHPELARIDLELDATQIRDLAELRAAVATGRREWHEHTLLFSHGLLARTTHWQSVYRAGPFHLRRFIGELNPEHEGHIGEAIHRDDGSLEYLKTYRLSAAQVRRAYLLQQLANHDWHLGACAEALGDTVKGLMLRLKNAGFAYLLKPHLLRGL
ncbi:hypothetical protein [Nannocystis sp.]|uniref:ARPP-2 domain-containing protein n=1 Tax=Nannocystis sp. TaxID=1962667 RepID=UPI0025F644BB|nr:hypothetical protein [Nannocystis sp.]